MCSQCFLIYIILAEADRHCCAVYIRKNGGFSSGTGKSEPNWWCSCLFTSNVKLPYFKIFVAPNDAIWKYEFYYQICWWKWMWQLRMWWINGLASIITYTKQFLPKLQSKEGISAECSIFGWYVNNFQNVSPILVGDENFMVEEGEVLAR